MSDDEKIIRPAFGDPPITTDRHGDKICWHEYVAIRPEQRVVICRVCKREIDAFEVLLKLARSWDNVTWVKAKLDEADAKLEALKAEEKRVKGRLRAAYKQGDPEPKAKVYVDELVSKLADVKTYEELHRVHNWMMKFKWVDTESQHLIETAMLRAENRVAEERKRRRRRGVRVIDGGKSK